MEPDFNVPDETIQRAVRMTLGEALQCHYDIFTTLPERLLVHRARSYNLSLRGPCGFESKGI
jgi:hypothetical protein